jgi:hypothetical protein
MKSHSRLLNQGPLDSPVLSSICIAGLVNTYFRSHKCLVSNGIGAGGGGRRGDGACPTKILPGVGAGGMVLLRITLPFSPPRYTIDLKHIVFINRNDTIIYNDSIFNNAF